MDAWSSACDASRRIAAGGFAVPTRNARQAGATWTGAIRTSVTRIGVTRPGKPP